MDEPSVGLAPISVSHTITTIKQLKERTGLTVLMAEQNFHQAIRIADRGYIIVHGEIVFEGDVKALEQNELVKNYYPGPAHEGRGFGFRLAISTLVCSRITPSARCACWSASGRAAEWTRSRA